MLYNGSMDKYPPIEPEGPITLAELQEDYCYLLSTGLSDAEAAAGIGRDRTTVFRWRKKDPEFEARCHAAKRVRLDSLVAEAERRAMRGSDKLLMFLLTNYAPDKFKSTNQKVEVTNPDGSLSMTESEKAARLAAILNAAKQRKDDGSDLC